MRLQERKGGNVRHSFEEHFEDVPWNGVKREKTITVPWFRIYVRDAHVTEIENGPEAGEIIRGRGNSKGDWYGEKKAQHSPAIASRILFGAAARNLEKPPEHEDGSGKDNLGTVSEGESETGARDKRARPYKCKIQGSGFPEQGKSQRDLPRASEPEIAPRPGSENRKEREENPARLGDWFQLAQFIKGVDTKPDHDTGDNPTRKGLEETNRSEQRHRND